MSINPCLDPNNTFTSASFKENAFAVGLGGLSMFATIMVATMMNYNPKLMEHPGKLIFLMCLCEAISVWSTVIQKLGASKVICYFGINETLEASVGWIYPNIDDKSISVLQNCNFVIQHYFQLVSLSLNFCLCLDVVLTMSSPFSPHERRMKFYVITCIIMAALISAVTPGRNLIERVYGTTTASESVPEDVNLLEIKAAIGAATFTAYVLYSTFSVTFAYRLNTRPGFSSDLRGAFLKNHVFYVLSYILTWMPFLGMCFYIMYSVQMLNSLV
jgi:hypothetical protein